jgi:hypothetical protein
VTVPPYVGQRVRSHWGFFDGTELLVVRVSGHGEQAYVTVEVPLEDLDGHVVETMTMTYRAGDLDAA